MRPLCRESAGRGVGHCPLGTGPRAHVHKAGAEKSGLQNQLVDTVLGTALAVDTICDQGANGDQDQDLSEHRMAKMFWLVSP